MATFDQVIGEYYIDKFYGYQGNPPTTEQEYLALNCWKEDATNIPTWQDISSKMALVEVQKARAKAYPTIQQQLDMQYWDSVNGTTTWQDAIEAIKTQYPKP